MYDLSVYDAEFFSTNQWEGLRHAEWFCPLLVKVFNPQSVVDVGCGTGHFLKGFIDSGLGDVFGIEGADAALRNGLPGIVVWQQDLRTALPTNAGRRFDIVISIEVAEHIEAEYAGVFVDTLCALSDTIVMTAAPPGQGGLCHVNEQEWLYWRDLFRARGYWFDAVVTDVLKKGIVKAASEGHHVATWFYKNIMVWRRDNVA